MKCWMAKDTKEALANNQLSMGQPARCESRTLLLQRFPRQPVTVTHREGKSDAAASREKTLESVIKAKAAGTSNNWTQDLPESHKRDFTLITSERLALGLANGIHENAGIDLDGRLGVPFISGSKLKGIASDAARQLVDSGTLTEQDRITIFGNADDKITSIAKAGKIAFMAAYPIDAQCRLEMDVLTVHFPKYYDGREPLDLDTDNPIPALFPVVAVGQHFRFVLFSMLPPSLVDESRRLLNLAQQCLKQAIIENGVGGKTRAAYGRFQDAISNTSSANTTYDNLFDPGPESEPSSSHHKNEQVPESVDARLAEFLDQWLGQLNPEKVKAFAASLRKLPNTMWKPAFDSCMPEERRINTDRLWSAFCNRRHGIDLLNDLNIR